MGNRRTIFDCFHIFLVAAVFSEAVAVDKPPSILLQPQQDAYFSYGKILELPCIANGIPSPRCKWYKNGVEIDIRNVDHFTHEEFQNCSLVIKYMEREDEGIYQCRASNPFGESLSLSVNVILRFKLPYYEIALLVRRHYPRIGESFRLPCIVHLNVSKAKYHWILADVNMTETALDMSNGRISMDYSGNLYFANIQKEDDMDGYSYICVAVVPYSAIHFLGQKNYIFSWGSTAPLSTPTLVWSSPSSVGLMGDWLRLKCIFSGNPTPIVTWTVPDTANSSKRIPGQEIEILLVGEEQEGNYICSARSTLGIRESHKHMYVRIESRPYFIIEPQNIETTKGLTTSFICKTGGKPIPDVQWYINGVKIQDSKHPTILSERFLRPDQNNITFVDLRKTDTMCIQCNASNKHGYVFTDVFLNVVDSPVI